MNKEKKKREVERGEGGLKGGNWRWCYIEILCDSKSFVGPTKEEDIDSAGQNHPCW